MADGRNGPARGGRTRDARVSLRSVRARRVQAVDGTVRDTGRRDGRHAARGKIGGPASRGETGAARERGRVFAQKDGGLLPVREKNVARRFARGDAIHRASSGTRVEG